MALGLVLYFNEDIRDHTAALEEFFSTAVKGQNFSAYFLQQIFISQKTNKPGKSAAFNLSRFITKINQGKSRMALAINQNDAGHEFSVLSIDCSPKASAIKEVESQAWLYELTFFIDTAKYPEFTPEIFVELGLILANELNPIAGVIISGELPYLSRYLQCAGSDGLNQKEIQRIDTLYYQRSRWGADIIRGPEWGTFLSDKHLAQLGGYDSFKTAVKDCKLTMLNKGGAYLQMPENQNIENPNIPIAILQSLEEIIS